MVTCANHNGYASQLSYFADYNNIINKYTLQILQSRIHFTRTQEKKIVFKCSCVRTRGYDNICVICMCICFCLY